MQKLITRYAEKFNVTEKEADQRWNEFIIVAYELLEENNKVGLPGIADMSIKESSQNGKFYFGFSRSDGLNNHIRDCRKFPHLKNRA